MIQAGRLNLDIGQFTQTASGQLLGAQSLTGTGDTWTNDGLLASDGTLKLTLTGGYSGNGRVSSLGDMTSRRPTWTWARMVVLPVARLLKSRAPTS